MGVEKTLALARTISWETGAEKSNELLSGYSRADVKEVCLQVTMQGETRIEYLLAHNIIGIHICTVQVIKINALIYILI